MRQLQTTHRRTGRSAAGFTLVEMLVSVTLVLLMMTMFASIFSLATDSVSKQRGIAENDQRARSLTTVIRSDFQHRTHRYPLAFYPGESSATAPTPFGSRGGYLYISTNNPDSSLDDLIQFTVSSDIVIENTDDSPYYGAADLLNDRQTSGSTGAGISINPNQPEADDAMLNPNNTGNSTSAEVTYFVRRGNLYRRLLMIRKPLPIAGQSLRPQPTSASGYNLFSGQPDPSDATTYDGKFEGLTSGLSNDFWRYFDYSAVSSFAGTNQSAKFVGVDSLSNETVGAVAESFGNPIYRFGFNPLTGVSREHTSVGVPLFLGRFVHAETSATNFNYPQNNSVIEGTDETTISGVTGNPLGTGNPWDLIGTPVSLNVGNGLVSQFDESTTGEGRGGVRRYEDLLLANVHELRIELWDAKLQRFMPPAHGSGRLNAAGGVMELGDYHLSRRRNPAVGPFGTANPAANHVFDTWHPAATVDLNGDSTPDPSPEPPFLAYEFYPPRISDTPPGPSPDSMPDPRTERARNRGYREASLAYTVGQVVFVPWADSTSGALADGLFQYSEMPEPRFDIAFVCKTAGTTAATPPASWPKVPGRLVTDGTVVWESFDNRRPLQSIRMTVRFMDQTTDTMRQLSLILPLVDKK